MFKQNKKILLSLLATALLSSQLHAGFLNFDGELTSRVINKTEGEGKASTSLKSQLLLSGSKKLPDGYKVNYSLRTDNNPKAGFKSTGHSPYSLELNSINLEFAPNSATTLRLGRQATPISTLSETIFDQDLYFDGLAAHYSTAITPQSEITFNTAYLFLEDKFREGGANRSDYAETLFAFQAEGNIEFSPTIEASASVALLKSGHATVAAKDSNATLPFENLIIGLQGNFILPGVKNLSVYTEMNENTYESVKDNKSTTFGIAIGDETVAGIGSWKVSIENREVEANSGYLRFGDNYGKASESANYPADYKADYKGMNLTATTGISKTINAGLRYQSYEANKAVTGVNKKDTKADILWLELAAKF